jgi:hypothetical protein
MTDQTLDELIDDFKNLSTSDHAHAIGHLCLQWSILENVTGIFLSILLEIDGTPLRAAVVNNIDQRDKWKMLEG